MKPIRRISIFGDSILRGVVLNETTRRYSVSNSIGMDSIAGMYSIEVTNNSHFGCTIDRGYDYIIKFLERGNSADAVLLELGGNDSDFKWSEVAESPDAEHFPNTPLERFTEIYHEIISLLRSNGIVPVLTNLPPLVAERYLDWICRDGLNRENILRWLGSTSAIYRYQENYSHSIEKIADETGCKLVDLRGAFLRHRRIEDFFCDDGIHPNINGQGIIHSVLVDTINKNKGVIYA